MGLVLSKAISLGSLFLVHGSYVLYLLHYPGWVAYGDAVVGDVVHHDGACSDGAVVANADAREDGYGAAYPAVVAYADGLRPLHAGVALGGVGAVAGGVDGNIRSDEGIIADGYGCFVQYGEVEIGEETLADADVLAVIAVERLVDEDVLIAVAEDLLQHLSPRIEVGGAEAVVLLQQVFALVQLFDKRRVAGVIDFACQHFLFLGFHNSITK